MIMMTNSALTRPLGGIAESEGEFELCRTRGFHGPFDGAAREGGIDGHARCAICGSRVRISDHLPAYSIARFHGLVP